MTAVTLTVAKAFNIAFKAYMIERRKRERVTGSESPRVQRKQLGGAGAAPSPKPSHLLKTISPATSTGPASGPYTPPVDLYKEFQDIALGLTSSELELGTNLQASVWTLSSSTLTPGQLKTLRPLHPKHSDVQHKPHLLFSALPTPSPHIFLTREQVTTAK